MPFDPARTDLTIAVVGTGAMGRGIMQVAAQGGMRVLAFDERPGAAVAARDAIAASLEGLVEKGRIGRPDLEAALARIVAVDDLAALGAADLVVEAIVESLDAKRALFSDLDRLARPDAILASNTSSLPITAIAAVCSRPERVAGLHFFNPVPLMKLVEVIPGLKTAPWVVEALMVIGRRMTREPVLCSDSPGFIVNHIGRAYGPEAARILSEQIAEPYEIDDVLTGGPGFRMGPFALQDLVGADVSVSVMESLLGQFYGEPMYAPQPLQRLRVDGGLHGQKTGEGWYSYAEGKKVQPPRRPPPDAPRPASVWLIPSEAHREASPALRRILAETGVEVETGSRPSPRALIVTTPVGFPLVETVVDLKLDPQRTVAVDLLFGLKGPLTLMVSPATDPAIRDAAHAMLAAGSAAVVVINDSPGFIAQRIVAHIVNVSCQIAQRGIAAPADIDKGAKLGLGYPFGPLEWGDRIGPARVLHILECLYRFYGEPRYRPSAWLKRRAVLGLSLLAPEGRMN